MKAILITAFNEPPIITEVADPEPEPESAIIKVEATGICRSDWHGWKGHDPDITLPHVPGHELAGYVVETGSKVNKWEVGRRVTVPFSCGCGYCAQCNSGNQQICDNYFQPGFTNWGSFAEYVEIKYADENLVPLPDDFAFQEAAVLGCRFGTSFRGLIDQAKLLENEKLVIVGCGGVGLSALLIAKALGAWVVCVDTSIKALNKAKEMGANEIVLNKDMSSATNEILDYSEGGCHVSLEAIGHPEAVRLGLSTLRKRGRHIQIGLLSGHGDVVAIDGSSIISKELELIGSHGIQASRYKAMLEMVKKSSIDLNKLIEKCIHLDEAITILTQFDTLDQTGVTVITNM